MQTSVFYFESQDSSFFFQSIHRFLLVYLEMVKLSLVVLTCPCVQVMIPEFGGGTDFANVYFFLLQLLYIQDCVFLLCGSQTICCLYMVEGYILIFYYWEVSMLKVLRRLRVLIFHILVIRQNTGLRHFILEILFFFFA